MADMAPATPSNEARRNQMLRAAAELICERGFGETRIADVAKRAEASSALVIYYFGTRDRLLVDALRYSEQNFYDTAEKMLAEVDSASERLVAARALDLRTRERPATCPAPGGCGSTCGRRRSGTPRSSRTASSSTAGGAT